MKKVIVSIILGACLLTTTTVVAINVTESSPSWMNEIDQRIDEQIKEKNKTNGIKENNIENSLPYGQYLQKVKDKTKKDELLALQNDTSMGKIGEWKRQALKIIGEIPENQKRLDLESAKKIAKEKKGMGDLALIESYNKIAGAPDWEGGSGIPRSVYFLDETQNNSIVVVLGQAVHVFTDENGSKTETPLTVDLSPSPTTAP